MILRVPLLCSALLASAAPVQAQVSADCLAGFAAMMDGPFEMTDLHLEPDTLAVHRVSQSARFEPAGERIRVRSLDNSWSGFLEFAAVEDGFARLQWSEQGETREDAHRHDILTCEGPDAEGVVRITERSLEMMGADEDALLPFESAWIWTAGPGGTIGFVSGRPEGGTQALVPLGVTAFLPPETGE